MFIRIVRPEMPAVELLEVIVPRRGDLPITAAERFLGAMALRDPFALELAATSEGARFLVRAGSPAARDQLAEQLCAAYPQAEVLPRATIGWPNPDPACRGPQVHMAACALVLRGPDYLPLRTFEDRPGPGVPADPLTGILGALGALPPGWRALAQLLLHPAAEDWGRDALPLALEPPDQRRGDASGVSTAETLKPGIILGAGLAGMQGYLWYRAEDWGQLGLAGGAIMVAGPEWRRCAAAGRIGARWIRAWSATSSAAAATAPSCAWPSLPRPTRRARWSSGDWPRSRPPTISTPTPPATRSSPAEARCKTATWPPCARVRRPGSSARGSWRASGTCLSRPTFPASPAPRRAARHHRPARWRPAVPWVGRTGRGAASRSRCRTTSCAAICS